MVLRALYLLACDIITSFIYIYGTLKSLCKVPLVTYQGASAIMHRIFVLDGLTGWASPEFDSVSPSASVRFYRWLFCFLGIAEILFLIDSIYFSPFGLTDVFTLRYAISKSIFHFSVGRDISPQSNRMGVLFVLVSSQPDFLLVNVICEDFCGFKLIFHLWVGLLSNKSRSTAHLLSLNSSPMTWPLHRPRKLPLESSVRLLGTGRVPERNIAVLMTLWGCNQIEIIQFDPAVGFWNKINSVR